MTFLSFGDAPFFFLEQLRSLPWTPILFDATVNFGMYQGGTLWVNYPFRIIVKLLSILGCDWWMIERIIWGSILGAGFLGMARLSYSWSKSWIMGIVSGIIYCLNTYVILLISGGQLGIVAAYMMAPWAFQKITQGIERVSHGISSGFTNRIQLLYTGIHIGVWISIIIACDIRIALLIISMSYVYSSLGMIGSWKENNQRILNTGYLILYTIIIPGVITAFLHAFWIIPSVLYPESLSSALTLSTSTGMMKFLSFADFTHALSLLHPNWPENIFGKTYFMQPEFLLFPLFAFASLLFIKYEDQSQKKIIGRIVFFSTIACIASWFGKGANDPGGSIYMWMYAHIPGLNIFRDSTKYYILIAFSYAILIPFTIEKVAVLVHQKMHIRLATCLATNCDSRRASCYLLTTCFILFCLITVREIFLGTVTGNLRPSAINQEYIQLKNYLIEDASWGRSVSLPLMEKTTFASDMHPSVAANILWKEASVSSLLQKTNTKLFISDMEEAGIAYVIVPSDEEQKMFVKDRVKDSAQREELIHALDTTTLTKIPVFTSLAVYKTTNPQPLMEGYIGDIRGTLIWKKIQDGNYYMYNTNADSMKVRLLYSPYWRLEKGNQYSSPVETKNGMMLFQLPEGEGILRLKYLPQQASEYGAIVSVMSGVLIIGFFIIGKKKELKRKGKLV